jgi:uncharacterized protein with gpF-like domain
MINVHSGKKIVHGQIIQSWVVFENDLFKKVYRILVKQWSLAAGDVVDGTYNIDNAVNEYRPELKEALRIHYKRVGTAYHEDTVKQLEETESRDSESIFWDAFTRWSAVQVASKVTMINRTTKKVLNALIAKAIADGLSYNETAKRIMELSPISNANRAKTIARTETHSIFGKSVHETALASTKNVQNKEWSTSGDRRVRERHEIAEGETVLADEPFLSTGEALDFPGDPKGSSDNIIGCRCIAYYYTSRLGV